jgi:hypothetical protein
VLRRHGNGSPATQTGRGSLFFYGGEKLYDLKKSHLTMEWMILDVEFADQLFTPTELATAKERIDATSHCLAMPKIGIS